MINYLYNVLITYLYYNAFLPYILTVFTKLVFVSVFEPMLSQLVARAKFINGLRSLMKFLQFYISYSYDILRAAIISILFHNGP